MNKEQEFQWTYELVKEYENMFYHWEKGMLSKMEYFKQSKSKPKEEDKNTVTDFIDCERYYKCPGLFDKCQYLLKTSQPIPPEKYPAIKKAIEGCLNNDNSDLIGLLRDCVSETWGNPSINQTQELFDTFLHKRKLASPTLKVINTFVTNKVNEIMYDKKYTEDDLLKAQSDAFYAAREYSPDPNIFYPKPMIEPALKYPTFTDYKERNK